MGISYNAKQTQSGEVELFSRQFDGNETDINTVARLAPDEADALAICLMEAASQARLIERELLNKKRESLAADAMRIKSELERVMREIAVIDEKQARARTPESRVMAVDGTKAA